VKVFSLENPYVMERAQVIKNIVTETKSTISRQAVNLSEEPEAENPQVRFCEGPGPTETWLKYCGTAGKPGGKRRKQTST
jgi:hypothetical protein